MIKRLCLTVLLLLTGCQSAFAEAYDSESIADAIWYAEGGDKAKKPYGILSVPCDSKEECRQICINTINNTFTRWQLAGAKGDFLEALARRYAPVGAENDPSGLNKNWFKNVKYYLERKK